MLKPLKVSLVLETVPWDSEPTLKKTIVAQAFKGAMSGEYITPIKRKLVGGKTAIQSTLLKC